MLLNESSCSISCVLGCLELTCNGSPTELHELYPIYRDVNVELDVTSESYKHMSSSS